MGLFDRLATGWRLGKTSLRTIKDNPSLMLFPFISGAALVMVAISFFGGGYWLFGEEIMAISDEETAVSSLDAMLYFMLFLFYLLNYAVIIFFNVGLVFCARKILEGKETSVWEGIQYAQTRVGTILSWAFLAATVGIILKTLQERVGAVGQIIVGLIGLVWSIATFFVIPVIAYENVSPFEAVKRSSEIMKNKWGESIGANFSFGLFGLLGILFVAIPTGILMGSLIHPIAGIVCGFIAFLLVQAAVSAANMVFLAAAYQHVNDEPTGYFDSATLDGIFVPK